MFFVPNKIYTKLRIDEIDRARTILKKIKIDTIFNNLTSSCWRHGVQYVTLVKNDETLLIKLYGHKECVLLKFHKTQMVFIEDYERFSSLVDSNGALRGIYITTGVFEEEILRESKSISPFANDIKIEDGLYFIRKNIGSLRKVGEALNKESFFSYLPN